MDSLDRRMLPYAMELVAEAESMGMAVEEMTAYVAWELRERFPAADAVTINVVSCEIVRSRNKGLW